MLGEHLDRKSSSLQFWMPYVSYSLSDLCSSPFFSPYALLSSAGPNVHASSPTEARFNVLAKSIIFQVISALAYLHDETRCIAHRDIKPNNILISSEGCVKLIDFGISWRESEEDIARGNDIWPEYPGKMYFEVSTG